MKSVSSTGVGVVSGTHNWRFNLKRAPSGDKSVLTGSSVSIGARHGLSLQSRRASLGSLSWVCTEDWKKCGCIAGSDCDDICKDAPKCNPKIPDECTCTGDPSKGGTVCSAAPENNIRLEFLIG